MRVWEKLIECHQQGKTSVLFCVLESKGSSPGRQGFKMLLTEDGRQFGTIGGGIMEHKLLALGQNMMESNDMEIALKRQLHHKNAAKDQSGMICSGEQTTAMVVMNEARHDFIGSLTEYIRSCESFLLHITGKEITAKNPYPTAAWTSGLDISDIREWNYFGWANNKRTVHIVGAGHVGVALSKVLRLLGHELYIYDDRPNVHTLYEIENLENIQIVGYENIRPYLDGRLDDMIVIVTSTYRSDKIVLKQLVGQDYFYLGCMGSQNKIQQLFEELKEEGIPAEHLDKVHAPIGLDIYSKTAEEIAISIAAELIFINNKHLPTGRIKSKDHGEKS